MPYNVGGCTSLLDLASKFPLLVAVLGLALFVQVANAQAPGAMLGTENVVESAQRKLVTERPGLVKQFTDLQSDFDKLDANPTEEQVRTVLKLTDACTDKTVKDVLSDSDLRRKVAWVLYLDTYSREGPDKANSLFVKSRGHTFKE